MAKAMRGNFTVEVIGLKEMRRNLKRLEEPGPWQNELKDAGKEAAEIVAAEARSRAPYSDKKKRKTEHIRNTIKSSGLTTGGKVTFGGASAPHAAVHEFGGSIPKRNPSLGKTKIPKRSYVFSSLKDKRPQVYELYSKRLDAIVQKYFGGND